MDETNHQKNPEPKNNAVSMKKKETNSVYERLEFPAGMTYAHRSSLRKECSRFLRFAYLADFLSLEALSTIYIDSVKEMIERIRYLDSIADMDKIMEMEFDDSNSAGQAPRGHDPLFYTKIILDDQQVLPDDEIMNEAIEDFLPPPRGKSEAKDFDLLAHLEVKEIIEAGEDGEESVEAGEDEDDDLFVQKFRKVTPKIQDFWIKLVPNEDAFISIILKTFNEGLQAIKCFERWSQHTDLMVYSEALETWDDKVGDDVDQNLESTSLNPGDWVQEHPIKKMIDDEVNNLIKSSYEKAKRFMTRFQPLLEIYWRNKQFDQDILVDVNLVNSVESL